MRASASAGARGASAGEGDAWGRDSRGGMRRRHQHGVKDYSISHSWARKENKKRREDKSGSDQLSHRENTPHTSPLAVPVPLPHPPAPLVSISETAFGLQKEIATPPVAGPETPHHQRILMESCKGARFVPLFNAPLAIVLSTPPCRFPARGAVNPRLAPFPNSQCLERDLPH